MINLKLILKNCTRTMCLHVFFRNRLCTKGTKADIWHGGFEDYIHPAKVNWYS